MDPDQNPTSDLLNILSKAIDANMYGSIEVYLEDGQITQITQRIIKKIRKAKQVHKIKKVPSPQSMKGEEISLKFSSN